MSSWWRDNAWTTGPNRDKTAMEQINSIVFSIGFGSWCLTRCHWSWSLLTYVIVLWKLVSVMVTWWLLIVISSSYGGVLIDKPRATSYYNRLIASNLHQSRASIRLSRYRDLLLRIYLLKYIATIQGDGAEIPFASLSCGLFDLLSVMLTKSSCSQTMIRYAFSSLLRI